MKALLAEHSLWVLMAARGVAAVIVLVPVIVVLGLPHRLITPWWPVHMARGGLLVTGFAMFYACFPYMGLADLSTIFFSAPLIIALIAAIWLKERIGPHRIAALAIGFTGIIIALNPTSDAFRAISILPLVAAVLYALAQVLARRMGQGDTALTTGLYTSGFMGVFILPIGWGVSQIVGVGPEVDHLRWDWTLPMGTGLIWIVCLGLAGMLGLMLLSRAYQIASASLIAPFDYSYLPMAAVMAFLVWGEVPEQSTSVGMAIIVAAGLYLAYREMRGRG